MTGKKVVPVATTDQAVGVAESLYRTLSEGSHPRTKGNLDKLWAALGHLRDRGSLDYSYKNVSDTIKDLANLRGERPAPTYQSIRNDEGKRFKPLIDAFRIEHGPPPDRRRSSDDSVLDDIADRHTQARVGAMMAENKALKKKLDNAHHLLSKIDLTGESIAALSWEADGTSSDSDAVPMITAPPTAAGITFPAEEIAAVRRFLSEMEQADLHFAEAGSLWIGEGDTAWQLVGSGFGNALRRISQDDPA